MIAFVLADLYKVMYTELRQMRKDNMICHLKYAYHSALKQLYLYLMFPSKITYFRHSNVHVLLIKLHLTKNQEHNVHICLIFVLIPLILVS